MKAAVAGLAAVLAGVWGLWAGTDGLSVLTAEGARRQAVAEAPRPVPDVLLRDARGRAFRLTDFPGRVVLVEFIYARCPTVCTQLGETFRLIGEGLPDGAPVVRVSVSFDPSDGRAELDDYARRFSGAVGQYFLDVQSEGARRFGAQADPAWRVARVDDPANLPTLLRTFEVTVIPDAYGGFEHNAALLIVDRRARLARIVDHTPPEAALEAVWPWL